MKKFLLFTAIILSFTLLTILVMEKTDVLGLAGRELAPTFRETDGRLQLSWNRLPYPCFYRIESYSRTTGLVANEPSSHLFQGDFTFDSSYQVPRTAIPMYYRVTAYGMFGRLTPPSEPIENPDFPLDNTSPVSIFHYTENHKASQMPFLVWHTVPTAVCYEVELLSDPNLLFLDEPASGLDPGTERNLMRSLRDMADGGKTVILVTHSTLQLQLCDKVVFMGKGGNLCFFGSYDEACAGPGPASRGHRRIFQSRTHSYRPCPSQPPGSAHQRF